MKYIIIAIFLLNNFMSNAQVADTLNFTYSKANGIGAEKGIMRRDPSDIIKENGLYYVWYSKGIISPGYDATIWYATSPDGYNWTEKGESIVKGAKKSWDEQSVFTPNILVANGKYWLFYTGIAKNFEGTNTTKANLKQLGTLKTAIGLAESDSPNGPWKKFKNPILTTSEDPSEFDSFRIDDACLITKDNKYWFYYKGRQIGKSPKQTKMGVAVATKPEGPYVKYDKNPVIHGNHEVVIYPIGKGVGALIGTTGPKHLINTLQYSEDGYNFTTTNKVINTPHAAGLYRPEAFTESEKGKLFKWGVQIGKQKKFLPFIQRFDADFKK